MPEYVHKKGIVYKNQFHVIFCPKYRRKVLADGVETRLREILNEEADNLDVEIKALEIMPDYVHIFIECDPRIALHKVIKQFKGVSSRKLRNEYPWLKSRIPSLWTRNYFSCTVGHINESTIIQYIEDQKHR